MKIYVDILFIDMTTETCMLEVDENTDFFQAKKLLLEKSYVYPEEQLWFCDDIEIKNKISWDTKFKYLVVVNNKWYNFNIKTAMGTNIEVHNLSSKDLISTVKYHIFKKTNLTPDTYKLMVIKNNESVELLDFEPIGKYFIPNNSTINLTIKLNSGFK